MKTEKCAYVEVMAPDGTFGVSICVQGEDGHRPLDGYSGYDEARAKGIAERLNKRLGVEPSEALRIILSTMGKNRRGSRRRAQAGG